MLQDPPPSTRMKDLTATKDLLEIECTDSCYFLNIPLDGMISLLSLRFESTSRCQEIYDSQENYIGTCTRIPRASLTCLCTEKTDMDAEEKEWSTTQLNLNEEFLVSGHLIVKVSISYATAKSD